MRRVKHVGFEHARLSIDEFDAVLRLVERGEKRGIGRFIPNGIEDGSREDQFTIGQVAEFEHRIRHGNREICETIELMDES